MINESKSHDISWYPGLSINLKVELKVGGHESELGILDRGWKTFFGMDVML